MAKDEPVVDLGEENTPFFPPSKYGSSPYYIEKYREKLANLPREFLSEQIDDIFEKHYNDKKEMKRCLISLCEAYYIKKEKK